MDPYQISQGLKPSRVIAGEILEFDGSFDLPKVSAISNWVVAVGLMRQGKLDQAIPYAQQAAELDPSSIQAREVLSTAYAAKHRNDDAEREYQAALKEQKKYIFAPPADPLATH
jgi:tetratricopeptide (TPR) repeat protein